MSSLVRSWARSRTSAIRRSFVAWSATSSWRSLFLRLRLPIALVLSGIGITPHMVGVTLQQADQIVRCPPAPDPQDERHRTTPHPDNQVYLRGRQADVFCELGHPDLLDAEVFLPCHIQRAL